MRAGNMGGRMESAFQPKRKLVAAPQILPWQGPMPQRVWSLAARQEGWLRSAPKGTSSQRQTMVASVGRVLSSGRRAKALARRAAKRDMGFLFGRSLRALSD